MNKKTDSSPLIRNFLLPHLVMATKLSLLMVAVGLWGCKENIAQRIVGGGSCSLVAIGKKAPIATQLLASAPDRFVLRIKMVPTKFGEGEANGGLEFASKGNECVKVLFRSKSLQLLCNSEQYTYTYPKTDEQYSELEVWRDGRVWVLQLNGEYLGGIVAPGINGPVEIKLYGCNANMSVSSWEMEAIQPVPTEKTAFGGRRLRGFSMSLGQTSIQPVELEIVHNQWNANVVNLYLRGEKMTWEHLMEKLPSFLDQAEKLKMSVVLSAQPFANPNNAPDPKMSGKEKSAAFWANEDNLKINIERWRDVARICKDRKLEVRYNFLSEPLDWNDFPSFAKKSPEWSQKLIDAIREVDSHSAIIVEAGPGGLCWGYKKFPLLKGKNIVYSAHSYQPHEYTHQGIKDLTMTDLANPYMKTQVPWPSLMSGKLWDSDRLKLDLMPLFCFQQKHKVPVFVGELSVARWAPNADRYLADNISVLERFGWDWTYHAWKENPIWSVEYEETYPNAKKAESETKRAEVLRQMFKPNS